MNNKKSSNIDKAAADIKAERGSKYGPYSENCDDIRSFVKIRHGGEVAKVLTNNVITDVIIGLKYSRSRFSKLIDHDVDIINYTKLRLEAGEYDETFSEWESRNRS